MAYVKTDKNPEPYVHQDWPAWYFGPDGQSAIFKGPLDVPDGWYDSPEKVGTGSHPDIPGYDEAVAAAGDAAREDAEDDEGLTKAAIVEKLKEFGVTHNASWSKARLAELLADNEAE